MSAIEILKYPDPYLQRECRLIEEFDDELRAFAQDMVETMHGAIGIGLAAPQVGNDRRLLVADLSVGQDSEALLVLANPEVEFEEGEIKGDEGCLSFPDFVLVVPRPARVVVSGQDLEGNPVRVEADGLMARCLHHEIDHLHGVLFINRVSPLKRDLARRKINKRIRAGDW